MGKGKKRTLEGLRGGDARVGGSTSASPGEAREVTGRVGPLERGGSMEGSHGGGGGRTRICCTQ